METIALDQTDKDFKYDIASRPGAHNFRRCFSCGTCTASCPVSDIDENFNPRLIIRQALLGMRQELLSSAELWYCAQCYTCYARCPQDVRFTDILAVLRDMAVEEGHASPTMISDMKKIDVLVQKVRHGLAELSIEMNSGAPGQAAGRAEGGEGIKQVLEEGIAGLGAHE